MKLGKTVDGRIPATISTGAGFQPSTVCSSFDSIADPPNTLTIVEEQGVLVEEEADWQTEEGMKRCEHSKGLMNNPQKKGGF